MFCRQHGARDRGGHGGNHHGLHGGAAGEAQMKNDLYPRLYLWLAAHRRKVFFAVVLMALGCIAISSRIGMEEDILGILPDNDPIVNDYKYTLKKFRQIDRAFFDVGINRDDPETL